MNRAYILDVKACLSQAQKKRGHSEHTTHNNSRSYLQTDTAYQNSGRSMLTMKTIHDTNHKPYENFKLTTNRNNFSYRNWIKGKLVHINDLKKGSDEGSDETASEFNEETFFA